jgi:hypothetical protein
VEARIASIAQQHHLVVIAAVADRANLLEI